MKFALLAPALLSLLGLVHSLRTVCYWNGKSFWREGTAKVTVEEIRLALPSCTHLIYGYAKIDDDDYHIKPVDKTLDSDKGKGQYRAVASLKRSFPAMSIMLSVGGNEDNDPDTYFEVLEKQERRTKFINSVASVLQENAFDGIDLAWEFPPQHEKYQTTSISSIFHKLKKTVGIGVDSASKEHRDQFSALVREMKAVLRPTGKLLSVAVLPHVNSSIYFDVPSLTQYVDMVNLWTVDYRTPERSPDKADFATPLTFVYPRIPFQNVEATVKYWLEKGADPAKLNLGISTWGRTWTLNEDSGLSGVPPLVADGPGEKGPHTKTEGLLSYYESCVKLVAPNNPKAPAGMLRRIADNANNLGVYAYRLPSSSETGLWLTFEDPISAAAKSLYAKSHRLGGVAVLDLGLDDSRGICDGAPFPITRAAKSNLGDLIQYPIVPTLPSSMKQWTINATVPTWAAKTYNSTVQQFGF